MEINRKKHEGNVEVALHRLNFCLTQFEKSNANIEKVFAETPIKNCSVEEMVGAMIEAEIVLLDILYTGKK